MLIFEQLLDPISIHKIQQTFCCKCLLLLNRDYTEKVFKDTIVSHCFIYHLNCMFEKFLPVILAI